MKENEFSGEPEWCGRFGAAREILLKRPHADG
jgi:hypothetical protein